MRTLLIATALLASLPALAQETTINYGAAVLGASDAGVFLADKRGYFRAEGIKLNIVPFDSAARMIAPLGAGQLDAAGGAISAGLFNATARGVGIKIVADKGSTPPGHGYAPFMVRADLVSSGRVTSVYDLRGLKVSVVAPGISPTSILNEVLRAGRLRYIDVDVIHIPHPQHGAAFRNQVIAAAITAEPYATAIEKEGLAVRFVKDDEVYPHHQIAVILYSEVFAKTSAAFGFARAYLRGARDYVAALKDGRINDPAVLAVFTEYTPTGAEVYAQSVSPGLRPDGRVNVDSLKKDLAFFREMGWLEGAPNVDRVVDHSYVDAAAKALGYISKK